MSCSAVAAANKLIELSAKKKQPLTHLRLQILLYISNGHAHAITNKALCPETFRAGMWGPFIPSLYDKLEEYGNRNITETLSDERLPEDSKETEIIESVLDAYSRFSELEIFAITHKPGTPWNETWEQEKYGVIKPKVTKRYYNHLLDLE